MQFKVPQFIDVEDKLFGPLTFKQFAYLAGGAGMIFVIYKLLPLWIGIFLILPIGAFAAALAFYKINGQPFIYYVEAALTYSLGGKLYIWKQRTAKAGSLKKDEPMPRVSSVVPKMTDSRLKDISWSLDVLDKDKQGS